MDTKEKEVPKIPVAPKNTNPTPQKESLSPDEYRSIQQCLFLVSKMSNVDMNQMKALLILSDKIERILKQDK